MESASNRFVDSHHPHHDLDLDDDDDDSDSDSDRQSNGLTVPIIIAHRPKMNFEPNGPYGYGNSENDQPMRSTLMYGRPVSAAQQKFAGQRGLYSSPPSMSTLSAILAAARQANYRRSIESASAHSQPAESQPQRLILLITRPNVEQSASAPRMQVISREESQQPR